MFTYELLSAADPEGWAQHKQRPFGKLPWRDYRAAGGKTSDIQLRLCPALASMWSVRNASP